MRALESAFGNLAQFLTEAGVDASPSIQHPDVGKPFLAKRTGSAGPPSQGFVRTVLPASDAVSLQEGDKPVPIGSRALEILIAFA
jgi:hypothetical protein